METTNVKYVYKLIEADTLRLAIKKANEWLSENPNITIIWQDFCHDKDNFFHNLTILYTE